MNGFCIVIDPVEGITMTKSKDNVEQVKKSENCSIQEVKRLFTDFYNQEEEGTHGKSKQTRSKQ
jgi:hypothetical protein